MFTAVAQKNLADAEKYFDEHLAQNDYYSAGEIRPGQWIGAGAERLGLKQNVSREQFHALRENRDPQTEERLTRRLNSKDQRRVFYDFTCWANIEQPTSNIEHRTPSTERRRTEGRTGNAELVTRSALIIPL